MKRTALSGGSFLFYGALRREHTTLARKKAHRRQSAGFLLSFFVQRGMTRVPVTIARGAPVSGILVYGVLIALDLYSL